MGPGSRNCCSRLVRARPDAVLMAGDMAPDYGSLDSLQELLLSLRGRWPVFM